MSIELKSVKNKGEDNPAFVNEDPKGNSKDTDQTGEPNGRNHSQKDITLNESDVILTVEEEDDDDEKMGACAQVVFMVQTAVYKFINDNWRELVFVFYICLITGYFVYFAFAIVKTFEVDREPSVRLLVCTIFGVFLLMMIIFFKLFGTQMDNFYNNRIEPLLNSSGGRMFSKIVSWFLKIAAFLAIVVYVIIDVAIDHPQNLMSVAGLALYVIIFYVFSKNPAKVKWHPVFWGIALQYILALIILRWEFGYNVFKYLGDRVTEFLAYSDDGALFMFGSPLEVHFFAFKVLPLIIFFYAMISVLYYLGVMQAVIRVIGRALAFLMGTTPAESLNAAGNIFVGMTESPLMIQPFLKDMTMSELHAVMVGGFATIAGSVLGAYISFGIPANHLMSASVMSAPAALAMSKLVYPEVEKPKSSKKDFYKMGKSSDRNIIEAASSGALNSIGVVAAIAVNVMAFLSILKFVNVTLTWLGEQVEIEGFTFDFICSYLFYPIAYFMGTTPSDCRSLGRLIGLKTFTNEFVAYDELSKIIKNKNTLQSYINTNHTDWFWTGDDIILPQLNSTILKYGILETRSEVVATYALCGFSNFGSIGILLGGLGALVPSRKSDLSKIVLSAMIAGNAACFMTGCVAGLLYKDY